MREITVRNRTSSDWLKRDCVVREEIRQGDYTTTVMRHGFCFMSGDNLTRQAAIVKPEDRYGGIKTQKAGTILRYLPNRNRPAAR